RGFDRKWTCGIKTPWAEQCTNRTRQRPRDALSAHAVALQAFSLFRYLRWHLVRLWSAV
ncbi:hypothetical protein M9458_016851, partial [Cirrhinus mrigala]